MSTVPMTLPALTPARLLWAHGVFYLLTGLWPLVSMESFIAVTGPKTDHLQAPNPTMADHWLVMTAGVLITAAGLSLLVAAWRGVANPETIALAIGVATGLTAIDLLYVSRGVIAPIYLGDAAVEVLLLLGWAYVLASTRRRGAVTPAATVDVPASVATNP